MRSILKNIETADINSLHWVGKRFNHKIWVYSATFLTRCGDWPTYVIILPLLLFLLNPTSLELILQVYFLDLIIENSLYLILKRSCKRNRPSDKLVEVNQLIHPPDKFSFPSGHTSSAIGIAYIMSYFFPQFASAIIPFACCVSLSRLILKVHFPTDIIAGSLLGIGAAKLALLIII